MLLILVPVGLATIVGLLVLWPGSGPTRAQQAADQALPPGTTYPAARVVSVEVAPDCAPPQPCTGFAVVEVLEGPGEGDYQQVELPPEVIGAGLEKGDGLVLTRDAGAEGGPSYHFFDYERDLPLSALAIAFALCVAVVARLRGLASLVGLGFAFFILLKFVLPGILAESSPTLITLVGSSAIRR